MENKQGKLAIRRSDYLKDYLKVASVSLSLIRAFECGMLSKLDFERPVLDVGCGDGLFAKMLFDDAIDFGIDASPKEIEMAGRSGKYLNVSVNRADSMPFPDGSFRTVFSNCVVEHIDTLAESFREIGRVLRPGGKFYCTTHSDNYEKYFFYSTVLRKLGFEKLADKYSGMWRDLWRHHNCYSADDWTNRLKAAGFTSVTVTPYIGPRAVHVFDLFLPIAAPTYFTRKLTGKWKLFPRTLSFYPALWLLRKVMAAGRNGDWCYLLEAVK